MQPQSNLLLTDLQSKPAPTTVRLPLLRSEILAERKLFQMLSPCLSLFISVLYLQIDSMLSLSCATQWRMSGSRFSKLYTQSIFSTIAEKTNSFSFQVTIAKQINLISELNAYLQHFGPSVLNFWS